MEQAFSGKKEEAHTVLVVLTVIHFERVLQLQVGLYAACLVVALDKRHRITDVCAVGRRHKRQVWQDSLAPFSVEKAPEAQLPTPLALALLLLQGGVILIVQIRPIFLIMRC